MRRLVNKVRVEAPDSDFPFARIKDTTVTEKGTPINEELYGDFHQFFEKLFSDSGLTANELPDNEYSGFQLYRALFDVVNNRVTNDVLKGLIGTYTTDDLIVMHGCVVSGPVGPGTAAITAGAIFYNGKLYKVAADAGIVTSGGQTLVWKLITDSAVDYLELQAGTSGSGLADYDDTEVKKLYSSLETLEAKEGLRTGTSGDYFKFKRIPIPSSWNMDLDATFSVAHGLSLTEYESIQILSITIIPDDNSRRDAFPVNRPLSGLDDGVSNINSTDINLRRLATGPFDNSDYSNSPVLSERGHIMIMYV